MMTVISPANIVKFDRFGNFGLWQRTVTNVLVQHDLVEALKGKQPKGRNVTNWKDLEIRMCLADEVMYHVMNEESPTTIWLKLESRYMSKSLTNKLLLKKLYGLKMVERLALD